MSGILSVLLPTQGSKCLRGQRRYQVELCECAYEPWYLYSPIWVEAYNSDWHVAHANGQHGAGATLILSTMLQRSAAGPVKQKPFLCGLDLAGIKGRYT